MTNMTKKLLVGIIYVVTSRGWTAARLVCCVAPSPLLQGWLGRSDIPLPWHEKDLQLVRWSGNLLAWATASSVSVGSVLQATSCTHTLGHIMLSHPRPHHALTP